ncbi:uncharacterized protein SPSK_03591 [Sporothrix schenckii 1099-18]|uniref:Uncharacterized protein n=1 Tax=Sporothrix schenckii 1099-18 TaxID=1397361 RepID=A0A0F2M1P9_SPOSC|nr:uncharacterized protein SPSK_03591 [Sporothrix schenckii 1099-18]KJR82690.1 hypothetical protein SPSK_03591 [Sporothrix schenckii 1099-18]
MACSAPTSPTIPFCELSNNSPQSLRALRQPLPFEDVPKDTSRNLHSRRRRRQQRHAFSIGYGSSQTTSSFTSDSPLIVQFHSFPPFRKNSGKFRNCVTSFFTHVTRLVRGGTALLWQPLSSHSRPDSPSSTPLLSSFPSPISSKQPDNDHRRSPIRFLVDWTLDIVDDDHIGAYTKAVRLLQPCLDFQVDPVFNCVTSNMMFPTPVLVLPPVNCGRSCYGGSMRSSPPSKLQRETGSKSYAPPPMPHRGLSNTSMGPVAFVD